MTTDRHWARGRNDACVSAAALPGAHLMLFNTFGFVCVFLPITLAGFFLLSRFSEFCAAAWLVLASLAFYAAWNPRYLILLLGSIVFNYAVGHSLTQSLRPTAGALRRGILAFGIAGDLGLLGYYKYANFFITNVNAVSGSAISLGTIILPLGISFFTFTQIAFLVDAYRLQAREPRLPALRLLRHLLPAPHCRADPAP